MGTVVEKTLSDGKTISYKAVIRINRNGYPVFSKSKSFSKKSLANEWIKRTEAEFEKNPDAFFKRREEQVIVPTLAEAIERYFKEVKVFKRSKKGALDFIARLPIGKIRLNELKSEDFYQLGAKRYSGEYSKDGEPLSPATVKKDFAHLKTVIKLARGGWGYNLDSQLSDFDKAVESLLEIRAIGASKSRSRLPTSDELQRLTNFYFKNWRRKAGTTPMHLVLWFAITSGRRENEICNLDLRDWNQENQTWLVRNLKNPKGEAKSNFMAVTPEAMEVIQEALKPDTRKRMLELGYSDQLLFPINSKTVSTYFTRSCSILEIEDLTFHDLRHEGATRYAEDGFTIPQLQTVTLHESWNTLKRYVNMQHRKNRLTFKEAMEVAEREYDKWYNSFADRQRYIAKIDYVEAEGI